MCVFLVWLRVSTFNKEFYDNDDNDDMLIPAVELTSTGNGGLDQTIELLITADGKLKVTRSDALHLEILAGITSQLKHLQQIHSFTMSQ